MRNGVRAPRLSLDRGTKGLREIWFVGSPLDSPRLGQLPTASVGTPHSYLVRIGLTGATSLLAESLQTVTSKRGVHTHSHRGAEQGIRGKVAVGCSVSLSKVAEDGRAFKGLEAQQREFHSLPTPQVKRWRTAALFKTYTNLDCLP